MHKRNQKGFGLLALALALVVVAVIVMAGIFVATRKHTGQGDISAKDRSSLPDISYYQTHKTDQFIVDMNVVQSGFPFKGKRSASPHQGAHVQFFGGGTVDWPRGGTAPQDYPPVYAPVDGVIMRVDKVFADHSKGSADLYEIDLAFAKQGSDTWSLHYSFEPFIPQPSPGFYAKFIDVTLGQHVKKGQIIAHMYIPDHTASGVHIHFHLNKTGSNGSLYAPAIFSPQIVQAFHDRWGSFGVDDVHNDPNGVKIPVCMGYKLAADENPFGTGAVDCLN